MILFMLKDHQPALFPHPSDLWSSDPGDPFEGVAEAPSYRRCSPAVPLFHVLQLLDIKTSGGKIQPLSAEQLDYAAGWIVVLGADARDHGLLTPEDQLE